MDTQAYRGKAQFAGCAIALDVIVYASQAIQDADITQNYESETIKDSFGGDVAERTWNEIHNLNLNMKLIGDTAANARVLNSVNPGGFLPMQQSIVLSDPAAGPALPAMFKGTFKVKSDTRINIRNVACGDLSLQLKKYADADQNTLMTSTPA